MTTETRDAAALSEQRLDLAAKVQTMRNELVATEGEERFAKAEQLQEATEQLEAVDRECQMAAALENAERMVKKLSQQPNRPAPLYTGTSSSGQFIKLDRQTGQTIDSHIVEEPDSEGIRGTYEYNKAFQEFIKSKGDIDRIKSSELRTIIEKHGVEPGFQRNEMFIPFRKDMTLGTTTNGTYTVAPDFRPDIITARSITPVMSRLVQSYNTVANKVQHPKNLDSGGSDQIGTTFRNTKGEVPNTTLSNKDTGPFGNFEININTGTMWTAVTSDFIADTPTFQAYVTREGMKAFAAAYDNEPINGVVASEMAEGVLSCTSVGITKTGVNNTLVATKVVEAFYAFKSQYGTRLAWVMARGTQGKLVNLLDANNRSLFLPDYNAGLTVGANSNLLSTPLYHNDFTPASGTSLPKSIIVGDWEEYLMYNRQGISVIIDDMSWARYNKVLITLKFRFGGAVRDYRAFQIVHESA